MPGTDLASPGAMNVGLYRGASALSAGQRHVEAIAQNLANVGTTGFKRVSTASHMFETQAAFGKRSTLGTTSAWDFTQGDLERTGRNLDLALFGEGFFGIESDDGEVYTRNGEFHLAPDGEIVDGNGHPVAWEERSGVVDPHGPAVMVDDEGAVRQGQTLVGMLRVVNFSDAQSLTPSRGGYWQAPVGAAETAHTAVVHQGALERSNAIGVEEIVAMIAAQRSFEGSSKVMSLIDQSYRRLTRNA